MKTSSGSRSGRHAVARLIFILVTFSIFITCYAQSKKSSLEKIKERHVLLGLTGYNYTDRYISSYSINGAGGGHIFLSTPTSGGSGVTCCIKLSKNSTIPIRVKVRWQVDGCRYVENNPRTGASVEVRHFYYKETDVDVQRMTTDEPAQIETHFYPDGTVKVLLTKDESSPRLSLNGRRPDKSLFPWCKNEKKPAE